MTLDELCNDLQIHVLRAGSTIDVDFHRLVWDEPYRELLRQQMNLHGIGEALRRLKGVEIWLSIEVPDEVMKASRGTIIWSAVMKIPDQKSPASMIEIVTAALTKQAAEERLIALACKTLLGAKP